MELVFDYAESFVRDRTKLPQGSLAKLAELLNRYGESLINREEARALPVSPVEISDLPGGLESSLYVLRVDEDFRLVFAADEDPIFDGIIITLLRLVSHEDLESALASLAQSLYGGYGKHDRRGICERHVTDHAGI
ncbi:MAG: hypothetical protein V1792_21290 [Pseudomonadota bacterium]